MFLVREKRSHKTKLYVESKENWEIQKTIKRIKKNSHWIE